MGEPQYWRVVSGSKFFNYYSYLRLSAHIPVSYTHLYNLQENMTFCVDIFLKRERFGLRWEDVVRIKKDGTEEFCTDFKDLIIL